MTAEEKARDVAQDVITQWANRPQGDRDWTVLRFIIEDAVTRLIPKIESDARKDILAGLTEKPASMHENFSKIHAISEDEIKKAAIEWCKKGFQDVEGMYHPNMDLSSEFAFKAGCDYMASRIKER